MILITVISKDFGGRSSEVTLALKLFPTLAEIRYAVAHLKHRMKPRQATVSWQFWPARAKVLYQPLGVVEFSRPGTIPVPESGSACQARPGTM